MTHQARKRFGQNFLHDQGVIGRIIATIHPRPGDALVEIGPGQGAITKPLLQHCGHLQVVELDRDLIAPLARDCQTLGKLSIHNADALAFDFSSLVGEGKLRVVGNLPYNISTPLLFHLLAQSESIADMHFMLQKEVVQRMAAQPGSKAYGRLSVMLQARCQVSHLFDIGPEAFRPAPRVDSAFVCLQPCKQPACPPELQVHFAKVVSAAFAHRRKTLRNNLKGMLTAEQIEQAGISPAVRAETLTLQNFSELSRQLARHQPQELPQVF